ncbi:hypothetical protein CXF59_02570 [Flavobacterium sp. ALD4]|jgi:hypothetical protein|nr:hypothetical protein CXF59_02570 [Flavobacterium sp. ALD4]
MKNNQKQGNYSSNENRNNKSFLRILRRFYSIKKYFCFDQSNHLKVDHEKLQIIYANIRV